jgi:hypothetical protein
MKLPKLVRGASYRERVASQQLPERPAVIEHRKNKRIVSRHTLDYVCDQCEKINRHGNEDNG